MKGANSSLPTTKIRSNTPQLDFKLKLFPKNSAIISLSKGERERGTKTLSESVIPLQGVLNLKGFIKEK